MKLTIRSMSLSNFKGCAEKTLDFNNSDVKIVGQNGAGKSTISDAFLWTFADCNTGLVKNPVITPLGKEECETRVEIELEVDGKPLQVAKTQKYKSKEIDGKITSSITNSYEINHVDKSQKNFIAELKERGIDMDNFIIYSSPNAFLADTSKAGRDKIRKILFEMAGDISDLDIAKEMGATEIVSLMEEKGYKLDEIKASTKSTIKKITDNNGKNNEIINSKIDGMLSSKTNVDLKVLQAQKEQYSAEIERIDRELQNGSGEKARLLEQITALKIEREKIKAAANKKFEDARADFVAVQRDMERNIAEYHFQIKKLDDETSRAESLIAETENDLKNQRELYLLERDKELDESELVCPVCKQDFPAERIREIRADFAKNKAEKLNLIKSTGEQLKAKIEANKAVIDEIKKKRELHVKTLEEMQETLSLVNEKLSKIPNEINPEETPEYVELTKQITELENKAELSASEQNADLLDQKNMNKQLLDKVVGEIALANNNSEIDAKVAELRERRKSDEITKAKSEKILSQIDELEMTKNEKLAESINKNFSVIEWHLWDRQKNGEIIAVTEPYIDGKPMSSCANGSLITLAKISICETLQKMRDQRLPIWCDDASLFSKNTIDRINIDTQFIQLIVKDGVTEIEIERG